VVVPRRAEYGEHVNDHQADFVRVVAERLGGIVPVYDVAELPQAIAKAREMASGGAFKSHNAEFCDQLSELIEEL
jgi:UDP-N-acetylglucosamine transferase subunit ALG13